MQLNELRPALGSRKRKKRLGRGKANGKGGTSTKGHKGQLARAGGYHKRGFEGGQMPLQRRLPKRGFRNIFQLRLAIINLDQLDGWPTETPVTVESLVESGLVRKLQDGVKLLGRGACANQLTVRLSQVSATARQKIEAVGGRVEDLVTA